jgi:hypothetical protein
MAKGLTIFNKLKAESSRLKANYLTGFTGLTGYKKESSKFQVQWFKAKS